MAVIGELEGLEAWVEINGQKVQEYDQPDNDDSIDLEVLVAATKVTNPVVLDVKHIPHVIKYIEAIPDENFAVNLEKTRGFTRNCDHLGIRVTVDRADTVICHEPESDEPSRQEEWIDCTDSITSGSDSEGWTRYFYKFDEVKHVEMCDLTDDQLSEVMQSEKLYGLIKVTVYRMAASSKIYHEPDYRESPPRIFPQEIPEKVLKGAVVTTRSTFDTAPTTKPTWAIEEQSDAFQDPLERPCAVFEFRYRSKGKESYQYVQRYTTNLFSEGLYQEGVLERPDPVDSMSIDELRQFARAGYSHMNTGKVKQDHDQKIKRENGGDVSNRKRSASGNVELPRKRYKEMVRKDGKVEIDVD
ncbi:hypothetical protein PG994_008487 [Apiospora phragmitis]|uniref:DUF7918 domain-containing protein n=1 Tax=Apiospora phragmitis TaxID=2905665 RepID=A0ABR1UJK3_9PEZI